MSVLKYRSALLSRPPSLSRNYSGGSYVPMASERRTQSDQAYETAIVDGGTTMQEGNMKWWKRKPKTIIPSDKQIEQAIVQSQIEGQKQAMILANVIGCNCPTCRLLMNRGPQAILELYYNR